MTEDYMKTPEARETARKYADIMDMQRPLTDELLRRHPRMTPENRAKIFSPFAALRGYEQTIAQESARQQRVIKQTMSEEETEKLSQKLKQLGKGMRVTALYFRSDSDSGSDGRIGCYCEVSGCVEKLDPIGQYLRIDGQTIPFSDIRSLAGEGFRDN